MFCRRMELTFSMNEVKLTGLYTHHAVDSPLSLCLMGPHLEVSLVATPWRQGQHVQGRVLEGDWGLGNLSRSQAQREP